MVRGPVFLVGMSQTALPAAPAASRPQRRESKASTALLDSLPYMPDPSKLEEKARLNTAAVCIVRGLRYQLPVYCPNHRHNAFQIIHHRMFLFACRLLCTVHMLITFFEPAPQQYDPSRSFAYLWRHQTYFAETATIDLCVCFVYALYLAINFYVSGWARLRKDKREVMLIIVTVLLCVDALVNVAAPGHARPFRLLRPFMYTLFEAQQTMMAIACMATLTPLLRAFVVLWLCMLFYAVVGLNLFGNYYEDDPEGNVLGAACLKPAGSRHPFDSIGNSFVSIYVLATGDNHPSIIWPHYTCGCQVVGDGFNSTVVVGGFNCGLRKAASLLFFLSYLLIAFFCLANMILAMCYYTFEKQSKANTLALHMRKRKSLTAAYAYLQGSGHAVHKDEFLKCVKLVRSMYLGYSGDKDKDQFFFDVLAGNDGLIQLDEFMALPDILGTNLSMGKSKRPSKRYSLWKKSAARAKLKRVLEVGPGVGATSYLDVAMMVFVTVNVYLVCDNDVDESAQKAYSDFITTLFLLEVGAKVAAFGPRGYWSNSWNRFDAAITAISLFSLVWLRLEEADLGVPSLTPLLHLVASCRLLRLVKMLSVSSERYSLLIRSLTLTIPACLNVILMIIFFMYVFAVLGMEILGNDTVSTRNLTTGEVTVDFIYGDEFSYDFGDFGASCWSILTIVVGNTWSNIMFAAMQAHAWEMCWFFMALQFMSEFMMMNVIQSLFVFAFLTLMSKTEFAASWEAELEQVDMRIRTTVGPKRISRLSRLDNLLLSTQEIKDLFAVWLRGGNKEVKALIRERRTSVASGRPASVSMGSMQELPVRATPVPEGDEGQEGNPERGNAHRDKRAAPGHDNVPKAYKVDQAGKANKAEEKQIANADNADNADVLGGLTASELGMVRQFVAHMRDNRQAEPAAPEHVVRHASNGEMASLLRGWVANLGRNEVAAGGNESHRQGEDGHWQGEEGTEGAGEMGDEGGQGERAGEAESESANNDKTPLLGNEPRNGMDTHAEGQSDRIHEAASAEEADHHDEPQEPVVDEADSPGKGEGGQGGEPGAGEEAGQAP